MYPELFSISPITIHSYGLMIAVGFLAAICTGSYRVRYKRYSMGYYTVWHSRWFGGCEAAILYNRNKEHHLKPQHAY